MDRTIVHYFDYKSPYAYLAQAELFSLADVGEITVEWRPYTLDIPSFLGSAQLDAQGQVVEQSRNAHQWRRVKYSYMDCRREANRRGLTLRGPRKIYDSTLAHMGFLFAQKFGDFRPYHDAVFELFWRRELDIEDPQAISATLSANGIDSENFFAFVKNEGPQLLDSNQQDAESRGVFGVPSYLVDAELFWGAERFERVREAVTARRSGSA